MAIGSPLPPDPHATHPQLPLFPVPVPTRSTPLRNRNWEPTSNNATDGASRSVSTLIVTGMVAMLGLVISKENKTSEFRQNWIDGLRADLARYTGHLNVLQSAVRLGGRDSDTWRDSKEDLIAINQCAASTRLRLNPDETASQRLLAYLNEIEAIFKKTGAIDEAKISQIERALLAEAQTVLKSEWIRVRNGEKWFQAARWISFLALGGGIIFFFYFALRPDVSVSNHEKADGGVTVTFRAPHLRSSASSAIYCPKDEFGRDKPTCDFDYAFSHGLIPFKIP